MIYNNKYPLLLILHLARLSSSCDLVTCTYTSHFQFAHLILNGQFQENHQFTMFAVSSTHRSSRLRGVCSKNKSDNVSSKNMTRFPVMLQIYRYMT